MALKDTLKIYKKKCLVTFNVAFKSLTIDEFSHRKACCLKVLKLNLFR